jgi:hypothetical protein
VAVLLVAILHLVPVDEEAHHTVRVLREALVPGGYIVISHPTREDAPPEFLEQINRLTAASAGNYQYRSRAQIRRFFDGLELLEPGLVHTPLWRPEGPDDLCLDRPERALCFAGVGRKKGGHAGPPLR